MSSQTPDPRAQPAGEGPSSLLEQFGRTKSSFSRLISAHVGLLKAEIGEILALVKVMGTLAGIAFGVMLMLANMLYVGGFLFLGEWLFGSIGWGFAHGVLFAIAVIVALMLGILGAPMGRAIASFVLAIVVAIVIAVLLGLNIPYNAASSVAASLASPFDSPGLIAALAGAVIGAVLFALLLGRMAGRGGFIGGLVMGLFLGALIGWLMAGAPWTWPPAVGFAITIGLLAWILFNLALSIPSLDIGARFAKLQPTQTIEAVNETKAFLEEQWRKRQPKLGKK
jgi:MFS family permease